MARVKAKIDGLVEKAISRKFLVWLTATAMVLTSNLESSDWIVISGIYIGGQAAIDGIAKLKSL
jgi:hypothetical protein|tara:strand:+ start:69 stop:260 length:192 start_codon:yes stop_codon:yes gene_type:complete